MNAADSNSKFIRNCGQGLNSNTIRQRQYKLQSQTTKLKKIAENYTQIEYINAH